MCIGIEQYLKLRDWIDPIKLDLQELCNNKNALIILEKRKHELSYYDWTNLCKLESPSILYFIFQNINLIEKLAKNDDDDHLSYLCKNPCSLNILKYNNKYNYVFEDYYYLLSLVENPNAIDIIEKNIDKLKNRGDDYAWSKLCRNPNSINILKKYLFKLTRNCWDNLCENSNAESLLLSHYKKISYTLLAHNHNKNLLEMVKKNIDFSDKDMIRNLCFNSSAINIIKDNIDLFIDKFNSTSLYLYDGSGIKYINHDYYDFWEYLTSNSNLHQILHIPEVYKNIKKNHSLHMFLRHNEHVLKFFKNDINKKNFIYICENENLIDYIEKNFNKFVGDNNDDDDSYTDEIYNNEYEENIYSNLSSNPNIFTYDYSKLLKSKKMIHNEYKRKYYMLDKQKCINKYNCNIIIEYL